LIGYIGSSNAAVKGKNLRGVSNSYEELKAPLVEALEKRPFHPESAIYLSAMDQQVFQQTKDEQFLEESFNVVSRALEDEPYNKELLKQLAGYYDLKGQSDLAFVVYHDNAYKFNWDIDWYDALISRAQVLATAASAQKDEAKKQEYISEGLEAYKHVVDGVEHLKTLPPEQLQGRPFSVTPGIALNAGKLQQLAGDNEAAAATVKLGFNESYADIMNSATLWDTNWYNALISRSYDLAQQSFAAQDTAGKALHLNIGLTAYNQVSADLQAQAQAAPATLILNAGRIQLMAGQHQAASATLQLALTEDYSDATNREIARWYLAALQKSGTATDQAVYDKLIAADPAEAAQIEQIVNTQFQDPS
jgi:hypothetical protein